MNKIFSGGYLSGRRTYIVSAIGMLSAIGGYLVGDTDVFGMLQALFPLAGIYFLRKGINESHNKKGNKNGNTKKVSK